MNILFHYKCACEQERGREGKRKLILTVNTRAQQRLASNINKEITVFTFHNSNNNNWKKNGEASMFERLE
jgi:hypothetical protein